jgi:phosphoadenylyl-sulfate reductase (thioredoxin)
MVGKLQPDLPILFLDTGMLFAQTLDYRQALSKRLGLTQVRDLRPAFADLATTDPGSDLWRRDTDTCCEVRKVLPLERGLGDFEAWITGRKRFHGGDRMALPVVERADGRIKFNPLANWDKADLDAYIAQHDLPPHPLVAHGYPSVGCWPCTNPVEEGEDVHAYWRNRLAPWRGWTIAANTWGTDRGTRFSGRSAIFDPDGKVVTEAGPEGNAVIVAEVDGPPQRLTHTPADA